MVRVPVPQQQYGMATVTIMMTAQAAMQGMSVVMMLTTAMARHGSSDGHNDDNVTHGMRMTMPVHLNVVI